MATRSLVQFFRALSEEPRLRAVMLLLHGELCVCDLMVILGEPQSKISRHLAYLKHTGIVSSRRVGLWMYYSLQEPMEETYRVQLRLLKEKFSSRPPFQSDAEKMLALKAQGTCKARTVGRPAVRPRSRLSGKKKPSFSERRPGKKDRLLQPS